ncbi:MAG: hypothetical protein Q7S18_01790 [bacterium]|nr:hypothetical protein [bacterium]
MSSKIIIIFLIVFLIASFGFLAYTESNQQNPQNQNWWVVYFQNPKDESMNFTIKNNSDQKNFHWEVLKDKNKIQKGDVEIEKGNKEIVEINLDKPENKITVKITSENESKEIYKVFGK